MSTGENSSSIGSRLDLSLEIGRALDDVGWLIIICEADDGFKVSGGIADVPPLVAVEETSAYGCGNRGAYGDGDSIEYGKANPAPLLDSLTFANLLVNASVNFWKFAWSLPGSFESLTITTSGF